MRYEVGRLVGLGSGATPMISIIKDIITNAKRLDGDVESGNGHAGTGANGASFPSFPGKGAAAGDDSGNRDNNSAESATATAAAAGAPRAL